MTLFVSSTEAHEVDDTLSASVLLENLACKATAALALERLQACLVSTHHTAGRVVHLRVCRWRGSTFGGVTESATIGERLPPCFRVHCGFSQRIAKGVARAYRGIPRLLGRTRLGCPQEGQIARCFSMGE